jgi:hypothetical protein
MTWGTHVPSGGELIVTFTYEQFSEVSVRYVDGRSDTCIFENGHCQPNRHR